MHSWWSCPGSYLHLLLEMVVGCCGWKWPNGLTLALLLLLFPHVWAQTAAKSHHQRLLVHLPVVGGKPPPVRDKVGDHLHTFIHPSWSAAFELPTRHHPPNSRARKTWSIAMSNFMIREPWNTAYRAGLPSTTIDTGCSFELFVRHMAPNAGIMLMMLVIVIITIIIIIITLNFERCCW